jgi:hypothetical protein
LKNYFNNIQSLLIVVLAVLLLLQRGCSSTPKVEPKVITKVETKWDTVKITETKYVPKWKTKIEYRWDTIPLPLSIDTINVINDYFSKYSYIDTINFDSLGYVMVIDTITQNQITGRNVQSNLLIPTKTITNNVYLNKRELFFGVSVNASSSQVEGINSELLFINKKRQGYGIGVGINPDFQPIYTGRLYWKIGN